MLPSLFMAIENPNRSPCLTNSAFCALVKRPVVVNSIVEPSSSTEILVGKEQCVDILLTFNQFCDSRVIVLPSEVDPSRLCHRLPRTVSKIGSCAACHTISPCLYESNKLYIPLYKGFSMCIHSVPVYLIRYTRPVLLYDPIADTAR